MRLLNAILPVFMAAAILGLSGCCGNSKKTDSDSSVVTDIKKEQVRENVSEFVYPLPTPFEVTNMLNRIGASYILSLSNPAENAEKYFTEKSKALNLGVYSADLSYASTYNQKQNTIDYMNASNKLIEELDFSEAIDENLPEKIEKFENDREKLIDLISNSFYKTYEYLNKNDRAAVSVMVLTGSWVEGLYIATHISEDTYNNVEMVKIVMEQKEPLNQLMDMINEFSGSEEIKETGVMLEKLHGIFNQLDDGSISQEQMQAITTEVAAVRDAIVS